MGAVLDIAATGLRRFMRDKANWFFVFVFPIALIILIGISFGDEGADPGVSLVGQGALADELDAHLADTAVEVDRTSDEAHVRSLVAEGRQAAAVVISDDATQAHAAGEAVAVDVLVGPAADGMAAAQVVRTTLADMAAGRDIELALRDHGLTAGDAAAAVQTLPAPEPVPLKATVVDGDQELEQAFEGLGQFDLGASQQLSLFVFLASLAGAAALIESRQFGVTNRILSGPVTTRTVVLGETLARFLVALVQAGWIVVGSAVFFGVEWGAPLPASALVLAFCAVAASAAIMFGAMFDNPGTASGLGVGVGLTMAALGGSMLPLELFPDNLQAVSKVTPHHWAYQAWATIQRNDGGLGDITTELTVLLGMAIALFGLGAWALRRSMQRT